MEVEEEEEEEEEEEAGKVLQRIGMMTCPWTALDRLHHLVYPAGMGVGEAVHEEEDHLAGEAVHEGEVHEGEVHEGEVHEGEVHEGEVHEEAVLVGAEEAVPEVVGQ